MELLPDAYFIICLLSSNGKDSGYFIKWIISIQFSSDDIECEWIRILSPWRWFNSTNWNWGEVQLPSRSGSCTRRKCGWTNFWHLPSIVFLSKCHDANLIAANAGSQNYPENSPNKKAFLLKDNHRLSSRCLEGVGVLWGPSWIRLNMSEGTGPGTGGGPQVTRFEQVHVWSHVDPSPWTTSKMTENITFPQLHWRVVYYLLFGSCWSLIVEFSFLRHCRFFEYFHGCTLIS